LVEKDLADFVVEMMHKSDRIMAIEVAVGSKVVSVVSVYTPHIGLPDDIKKQFWEDLDLVIQDVPQAKKLFKEGDFNCHIGAEIDGYDTAHGGFRFGERNNGGVSILNFMVTYEMLVVTPVLRRRRTT